MLKELPLICIHLCKDARLNKAFDMSRFCKKILDILKGVYSFVRKHNDKGVGVF